MRSIKCFIRKNAGFTMTEMVVVIAVIAILAGMMIPFFSSIMSKGDDDVNDAYQKLEEANADITHNTLSPDMDPTVEIPTGGEATLSTTKSGDGAGGAGGETTPSSTKAGDGAGGAGGETTPSTAKPTSTKDAVTMTNCNKETKKFDSFTEALESDHLKSDGSGASVTGYQYTSLELNQDIEDDIIIPQTNKDRTRTAVKIYLNGHTVTGRVISDGIVNIYGGSKGNPTGEMGTIDARDSTSAFECTSMGGVGQIKKVRFIGKSYGVNLYDGIVMNSNQEDKTIRAGFFGCICEARYDLEGSAGIYSAQDFRRIEDTICTGYYGFKTSASLSFVKNNTFIGYDTGYYKIGGTQGGDNATMYNFSGNICIGENNCGVINYGSWNSNIVGTEDNPSIIIGKKYGFFSDKNDIGGTFGNDETDANCLFVCARGNNPAVKGRNYTTIKIKSGRFYSWNGSGTIAEVKNGTATCYTNSSSFPSVFDPQEKITWNSNSLTETSGTLNNAYYSVRTLKKENNYYKFDTFELEKEDLLEKKDFEYKYKS